MWCWGRFSFSRCKVIPKTGMMTGDQIREHAERTMAKNLDISVDRYQNLKRISHNNSELLWLASSRPYKQCVLRIVDSSKFRSEEESKCAREHKKNMKRIMYRKNIHDNPDIFKFCIGT